MKRIIFIMFLIIEGVLARAIMAQDIADMVSRYTSANGKHYMQPLADVFSANLNSGLFQRADLPKLGLRLQIGLKSTVAFIGTRQKTFDATTEGSFYPPLSAKAATVFGSNKIVSVTGTGGAVYNFPGGFEIDYVPLLVPQISIGSVYGTQLTVRYFMANLGEDIGNLNLSGFGLQHNIDQYLPHVPVAISVGAFMQNFAVGDIVTAKSMYYGLQASRSFGILILYGGLGYESGQIKVEYKRDASENQQEDISFNLKANNSVRMTVGLLLNLPGIKLHVDYNLAKQSALCIGLGFGI